MIVCICIYIYTNINNKSHFSIYSRWLQMFQSASSSGAAGHHLGEKGSFPSAGRADFQSLFFSATFLRDGEVKGAEDHPEMVYLHYKYR